MISRSLTGEPVGGGRGGDNRVCVIAMRAEQRVLRLGAGLATKAVGTPPEPSDVGRASWISRHPSCDVIVRAPTAK